MIQTIMQQRNIIIFTIILFLASSIWLFNVGNKFNDPDYQKDWWAVYFVEPKNDSSDFIIENHSDKKYFHWEVMINKKKINEGDVKIEKGASSQVQASSPESRGFEKITIQADSGDEKKEKYKNL